MRSTRDAPSRKLLHDPNRHRQVVGCVGQGQKAVRGDRRGNTRLTIGDLIDGRGDIGLRLAERGERCCATLPHS
jgi:hypothetical protein